MIIKIDGKDIAVATIKTQQMELRVLEIEANTIQFEVRDIYGESFNFVPRFFKLVYSDGSSIEARQDQATVPLLANETLSAVVIFVDAFCFKSGMTIQMHYGLSKLFDITVE